MTRAHDRPAIACRRLSKRYGAQQVLDHLDLDIPAGETIVILGRSGSGKSVLLKHLNGLIQPDEGAVFVGDTDIVRLPENELFAVRRKVGMLFQGGALFDSLTVGENVRFPLEEHDIGQASERVARAEELLDLVDLGGTQERMPHELSGGMRKRAALARALALQPEVMLYDEPTTGLDPVTGSQINRLIRDLQRRFGLTSVVVTHDIASAVYVADQMAFLYDGSIRAMGSVDEMRGSKDPEVQQFLSAALPEAERK